MIKKDMQTPKTSRRRKNATNAATVQIFFISILTKRKQRTPGSAERGKLQSWQGGTVDGLTPTDIDK